MDALPDLANPRDNLVSRLGILALDLNDGLRSMLGTLRNSSGVVVVARVADFMSSATGSADWRCYPQREPDIDRLSKLSPCGAEPRLRAPVPKSPATPCSPRRSTGSR